MKQLSTLLFTVMASGLALSAPPEVHRPDRYKDLYLNSMFTDPPPEEEVSIVPNDLPDWVLVGVSKYVGGDEVNIMNIKDRTRVTIPSKEATEMGFSIQEVKQGGNYIDDTVVTLKKGSNTGEVKFDPKFLVLKQAAGPVGTSKGQAPPNPSAPNGRPTNTPGPPPPPGTTPGTPPGTAAPATLPQPGGSRETSVPRPTPNPATTQGSGSSSGKRSRWISPKK